jgi:hypothetical protein
MNGLRFTVVFASILSMGQPAGADSSASSNAEAAAAAIEQQVNKVGTNPDQPPSARDAIFEAFKRQR